MSGRVAVTGAAGFIGGHVCSCLLEAGSEVVGIDNFDPFYDRSIKEEALKSLQSDGRFEFSETDIRDTETLKELFREVDLVIHLAARAGVRPSIENPQLYMSLNVEGTASVLEAGRSVGVKKVIFGGSSSVYGNDSPVPFAETAPAVTPISPYAASKRASEHLCHAFAQLYDLRVAALRFFTVYGARQRPDLAIHKFTRRIVQKQPIQQYGDGTSERDYTHIDDIVQGVMGAVDWLENADPGVEIFNLGESKTVSLKRLIELLAEATGMEPVIELLPDQPGDVRRTCADVSKARRHLGYDPSVPIEKGIPRFVDWYLGTHGSRATTTG